MNTTILYVFAEHIQVKYLDYHPDPLYWTRDFLLLFEKFLYRTRRK